MTTFAYTYGKDLQLKKKVETGKNPVYSDGYETDDSTYWEYDGSVLAGEITTSVYDGDNKRMSYSRVTAPMYGNDYKKTSTYNYTLKSGTTVKTSESRQTTTVTNGVSTKSYDVASVNYKVKKISVPSSRVFDIVKDQAMMQTDFFFTSGAY